MKEAITTVSGEVFCVTEWEGKVHMTLIDEMGEPIRVSVPRSVCNPRKREVGEQLIIRGRTKESDIFDAEFTQATLQKIETKNHTKETRKFVSKFSIVGKVVGMASRDIDNYTLTVLSPGPCEEYYTVFIDKEEFHRVVRPMLVNHYIRFSGNISSIEYRRYEFEGDIKQIVYLADSVQVL